MIPSYHDILYFIEVAKAQNISRAAERLAISQPSLSVALGRLESAVGTKLLHRNKKGVYLTAEGEIFFGEAEKFLLQWTGLKSLTLQNKSSVIGTLKLGLHASVALYTLRHFVPDLLQQNPQLSLQLTHDLSRRIVEGVISRKIDLGIAVNPVRHPDLIIRPLFKDEVTLWKSKQTTNTDVLIIDPELVQSQALLRKLKSLQSTFTRTIQSSNLEVIASLTAAGAGFGILPARVAANYQHLGIMRVKEAPLFEDEVCSCIRVENKNTMAVRATLTAIEKYLS
jgi:DNA-binding transcriptional LysR family regulator